MDLKFIGVIPARRGSKGLAHKNILKINNKTLLEIAVESALDCAKLDMVIVSTDYQILETGLEKFTRNKKFIFMPRSSVNGLDKTPTEEVVKEIAVKLKFPTDQLQFHIVLLQPTSPLRTSAHIYDALDKYTKHKLQKLASFTKVGDHHPDRMYRINKNSASSYTFSDTVSGDRQSLEPLYVRNGAIYISDLNAIALGERFANKVLIPYVMDSKDSINIDSELDFKLACFLMGDDESSHSRTI
jgi:CMP-N,N'-diacetyllegionaminic acid synthase